MYWFPPGNDGGLTNGTVPNNGQTGRPAINSSPNGIGITTGGASGAVKYQNYTIGSPGSVNAIDSTKGSPSVGLINLAAADTARVQWNQGLHYLETEQSPAGIQPDPFFKVFRFIMRAAFPTLAGPINLTTCDIGMAFSPSNVVSSGGMNGGGNRPGIQIGPTDNGKISIRSRKSFAAAYDYQQDFTYAQLGFPASPADFWCNYEIRYVSADANGPAKCKCYINNVQVGATLLVNAADGRVTGNASGGTNFLDLIPYATNVNSGVYTWYMKWMMIIMTPDETNNL